jgi:aminopeptidase N
MSAVLGPYAYPTYIVAESAGGVSMEGPGTTWVPRGTDPARFNYLVAHETAHQWFPALVGSDQWADPFADEALADMVARWSIGERRASRCASGRLDRPITAYSAACYYEVIYIQGGNFLDSLRRAMGDAAYWTAIRDYIAAHRFGFGSSRELLRAIDARTPIDVAARAAPFFPSLK